MDTGLPEQPVRPYIVIETNKVTYLTDEQAAMRTDIRRIRPGEIVLPSQLPSADEQTSPSG